MGEVNLSGLNQSLALDKALFIKSFFSRAALSSAQQHNSHIKVPETMLSRKKKKQLHLKQDVIENDSHDQNRQTSTLSIKFGHVAMNEIAERNLLLLIYALFIG